jgi:hypothetical protein
MHGDLVAISIGLKVVMSHLSMHEQYGGVQHMKYTILTVCQVEVSAWTLDTDQEVLITRRGFIDTGGHSTIGGMYLLRRGGACDNFLCCL